MAAILASIYKPAQARADALMQAVLREAFAGQSMGFLLSRDGPLFEGRLHNLLMLSHFENVGYNVD